MTLTKLIHNYSAKGDWCCLFLEYTKNEMDMVLLLSLTPNRGHNMSITLKVCEKLATVHFCDVINIVISSGIVTSPSSNDVIM